MSDGVNRKVLKWFGRVERLSRGWLNKGALDSEGEGVEAGLTSDILME